MPEPAAQAPQRTRQSPFSGVQHPGAGHGSKGKGVEGGEQNRAADGQGNRLIQPSHGAWDQQHRHEHGGQHQRGGHNRSGEFGHGVFRRSFWGIPPFDPTGDVFAHHDRVIDDDAGGHHHPKQNQAVEVGAAQLHEHQAAHQCHRHGKTRDQGQAPASQEQHQHHQHQQHGITQGGDGAIEVGLHVVRHIHDHRCLDTRREAGLQSLQFSFDSSTHLQGIGPIPLIEPHGHGALPVEIHGLASVAALSQLDATHILESKQSAVVEAAQDQILEILLGEQPSLGIHRQADQLTVWCR